MPPRISVVVPSYQGVHWVTDCLDSLAAQSLPWDDFELVLVRNGPDDGSRQVVTGWAEAHEGFQLLDLELETGSVTRARNRGLDQVRGEYVTFVDDDDRVRPRFLELLLSAAAPDRISTVLMGVVMNGAWDEPQVGLSAEIVLNHAGRAHTNLDVARLLHSVAGKALPTKVAREVGFDPSLEGYAEDTAFWFGALVAGRLTITVAGADLDAMYLYHVREGSATSAERGLTWENLVEPALLALRALEQTAGEDDAYAAIANQLARAPMRRMNVYLERHPKEAERLARALLEADLRVLRA